MVKKWVERITDKERLDWLQTEGRGVGWVQKSDQRGVILWKVDWEPGDETVHKGKTVRAAIDSAIRAERRAGRKREEK